MKIIDLNDNTAVSKYLFIPFINTLSGNMEKDCQEAACGDDGFCLPCSRCLFGDDNKKAYEKYYKEHGIEVNK